jgi:pilus assembly protein CpaE
MLRTMIMGLDLVLLEGECPNYDVALPTVLQVKPEGVVVSLDDDPVKSVQLIGQITNKLPLCTVIAISCRPELLIKAHRQGAKSLLEYPVQLEDLVLTLVSLTPMASGGRAGQGKIFTLLSARGGVGATSLGVNLASTLASDAKNRVVLVDLDLTMGAADVALDLVPEVRLTDIASSIDSMEMHMLNRALARDRNGLALLGRPARFQDVGLVHPEHVQRILKLLRITNTHLVVDLSKGWLTTDLEAMHMADDILLITQPEVCSLRNTVYLLDCLNEEGLTSKVRVVMNRVGAYLGSDNISMEKAQEVIGQPIFWQVPNDAKTMMSAWTAGVPLVQTAPKSKVQVSIAGLTAILQQPRDSNGAL